MCVVVLMVYLGTAARCEGCPWNDLMVACWQEDPEKRPSFQEIVDGATSILEDMGGAPPAPDVMGALVIGAWFLVLGDWRFIILKVYLVVDMIVDCLLCTDYKIRSIRIDAPDTKVCMVISYCRVPGDVSQVVIVYNLGYHSRTQKERP